MASRRSSRGPLQERKGTPPPRRDSTTLATSWRRTRAPRPAPSAPTAGHQPLRLGFLPHSRLRLELLDGLNKPSLDPSRSRSRLGFKHVARFFSFPIPNGQGCQRSYLHRIMVPLAPVLGEELGKLVGIAAEEWDRLGPGAADRRIRLHHPCSPPTRCLGSGVLNASGELADDEIHGHPGALDHWFPESNGIVHDDSSCDFLHC